MPIRTLPVLLFVKAKNDLRAADEDRTLDQVGLRHHQVDRLLFRFRQRARLEDRAAPADEVEEVVGTDVLLQKRTVRRVPVDVALFDADALLLQITSGVAARRSSRLPEEGGLGHGVILPLPYN
ncbi:MAG TPA: hypothetical protein VJ813_01285 [Vicinamibacterales bacterium]|nr:hypothetical protein [Vicinamibacterales bacterium]